MSIHSDASQNIAERLTWHTANRDQAGIAKDLADGKDISEVYGLGEAGLFDEFFYFLEELGIMNQFNKLAPKNKKRNSPLPFLPILLVYMMRIVAGLKFFWHIDPVILHSQPLMRLVGFNGRQVKEGTCNRGKKKSSGATENENKKKPAKIRGPVCPEFITGVIVDMTSSVLENLYNKVVAILAAHSFGVGSCLQASVIGYPDAIREVLGIEKTKQVVLGISMGYPDLEARINSYQSTRVSPDDFVQWYT